ncbi:MAG: hypothetical protein RBT47_04645 [Anaerolineae bacterium]|jgi:hypothetical protein|nr:hypothetical protein [Anaerolineae bacterium]
MIGVWFVAGLCLGWCHAWMYARSAGMMDPHKPAVALLSIVGGALLRWGMAAVLFFVALRQSVWALLLAFLGLWVMRWIMVFRLCAGEGPVNSS